LCLTAQWMNSYLTHSEFLVKPEESAEFPARRLYVLGDADKRRGYSVGLTPSYVRRVHNLHMSRDSS
jgi:hypothetical protein